MKRILFSILSVLLLLSLSAAQAAQPRIGVAWVSDAGWESCLNACVAIEEAGGAAVLLAQVKSTDLPEDETLWADENNMLKAEYAALVRRSGTSHSNAAEALQEVCAVVFTGGEDVSPTLYAQPEAWHGIQEETSYHAARDVSDYLLMMHCVENDVPVLALCRGMQMMAVASGASLMQDLPSQFPALRGAHRADKTQPVAYRDYAAHDVHVVLGSLLHGIAGSSRLANVPSLHHQAVKSVEGTPLRVSGTADLCGVETIEAVERTDCTFALGVQFHPEAAAAKHLYGASDAEEYLSYEQALAFFQAIVQHSEQSGV